MNICEDKIKVFLDRLLPLQESEQQILCPRCGHNELYTSNYFFLNPLSRYAHVYICEKCWMDEALRELDRQPIPLRIPFPLVYLFQGIQERTALNVLPEGQPLHHFLLQRLAHDKDCIRQGLLIAIRIKGLQIIPLGAPDRLD